MDLVDNSRGKSEVSLDWNDLLVQGFTVGLDQEPRSSLRISLDVDERGWGEVGGDIRGDLDLKGAL